MIHRLQHNVLNMERYCKTSAGSDGKYFNTPVGTPVGVFKKRERVLKN